MEAAFGLDFGSVRLHADGHAALGLMRMGALAFQAGEHVAVMPGALRDDVLAHELAHVGQARNAAAGAPAAGDPEREASRAAAAVGAGAPAGPMRAAPADVVQCLTPLTREQVMQGFRQGAFVTRTSSFFIYVADWWASGGQVGGVPPPGFVRSDGSVAFYDPRMTGVAVGEMPAVPRSMDELRLADAIYDETPIEPLPRSPGAPGSARRQMALRANEHARVSHAFEEARAQIARGVRPPPPSGGGGTAGGGRVDPLARTQLQIDPHAATQPQVDPLARTQPAAPPPAGWRARAMGSLRAAGRNLADGARAVGRGVGSFARGMGARAAGAVGRIAGPLGVVLQAVQLARDMEALRNLPDPNTLPEGAAWVFPGGMLSIGGQLQYVPRLEGRVHHRGDGNVEIQDPETGAALLVFAATSA